MGRAFRFEVLAIGIDRDKALVSGDRAVRRRDDDLAALDGDAGGLGVLVQRGARRGRHPRRADQKLERVDVAGSGVAHAAAIMVRAHAFRGLAGVHQRQMRIAETAGHRLGMLDELGQFALLVRDVEMAGTEVDVDPVRLGEFEQVRLGLLGEVEQRLGAGKAVLGLELLSAGALAGAELAAIAAGCAVAEAAAIDQHHVAAGLGQVRRSGQPGEAAADDHHVAAPVAVERVVFRPRADRGFVPGIAGGDGGLVSHELSGRYALPRYGSRRLAIGEPSADPSGPIPTFASHLYRHRGQMPESREPLASL